MKPLIEKKMARRGLCGRKDGVGKEGSCDSFGKVTPASGGERDTTTTKANREEID